MTNVKDKIQQGLEFEHIILKTLMTLARNEGWRILSDVWIPTNSVTGYTQIDAVVFTPYRFFCIEAKDWNGTVHCSNFHYWTVDYKRAIKTLSPVQQNANHIEKLKRYIAGYKLEGAVCFNEFTKIVDKPEFVYTISEFIDYALAKSRNMKVISEAEIEDAYNRILDVSTLTKVSTLLI